MNAPSGHIHGQDPALPLANISLLGASEKAEVREARSDVRSPVTHARGGKNMENRRPIVVNNTPTNLAVFSRRRRDFGGTKNKGRGENE